MSTSPTDLEDSTLSVVQLDGLVILKIQRHCKENLPDLVTGQLLGLDNGETLEVTNCFPFPSKLSETEEESDVDQQSGAEYQIEMMRCLREVNVDNNTVGWYSSTYMGSFISESAIETQFNYQERIKKSVMIIYDPMKTSQGTLSLKAYRLTQAFMDLFKHKTFTKEALTKANVSYDDIFEEVPIKIHNSSLVNTLLFELDELGTVEPDFELLDLSSNSYLEKNMEFLIDCLDELGTEQNKFQFYNRAVMRQQQQQAQWLQKRKAENQQRKLQGQEPLPDVDITTVFKPVPEPPRLESLLISKQINEYCKQINQFAGNSFTKAYLLKGVQQD